MKILIATNMYPTPKRPYFGVFVRQQAESLRARGHTVDVAEHIAEDTRLMYWKGLWALRHKMRGGDYDLIHSHHSYSTVLALTARRLEGRADGARRLPIVATFHESEVFQRGTASYGQDPLRRLKYSLRLKAWGLRRVDFVIPVQRDMLRRVLGEADAARIPNQVIPAGVDLERFAPESKEEARARVGWGKDDIIIFFPCDPEKPEKRADLARAGFERWRATLGEGIGAQARLIVGGGIPYEQMPDALRACDAVLVPTDYEASPTVVKEALACERPVVSTDVGDVRELFEGLAGVRICDWNAENIAAALKEMLNIREPFGGRERLIEMRLGIAQVAERVEGVYARVLREFHSEFAFKED